MTVRLKSTVEKCLLCPQTIVTSNLLLKAAYHQWQQFHKHGIEFNDTLIFVAIKSDLKVKSLSSKIQS